jgi:uncharacterized protein YegL
MAIDLRKVQEQAPELVNLVKTAKVSLEKANLGTHNARVALVLDISGSMDALYCSGKVQKLAERALAMAARFDDDGKIDVFLFGINCHFPGPMTLENFRDFVKRGLSSYPLEGGTNYAAAMKAVRKHYFPSASTSNVLKSAQSPVYVMFVTDGQPGDQAATRQQVVASSYEPIFWQFMGVGRMSNRFKAPTPVVSTPVVEQRTPGLLKRLFGWVDIVTQSTSTPVSTPVVTNDGDFPFLEELDVLQGRLIDNTAFFAVVDPTTVPDGEFFDLMMEQYPEWVKTAPSHNLLTK